MCDPHLQRKPDKPPSGRSILPQHKQRLLLSIFASALLIPIREEHKHVPNSWTGSTGSSRAGPGWEGRCQGAPGFLAGTLHSRMSPDQFQAVPGGASVRGTVWAGLLQRLRGYRKRRLFIAEKCSLKNCVNYENSPIQSHHRHLSWPSCQELCQNVLIIKSWDTRVIQCRARWTKA